MAPSCDYLQKLLCSYLVFCNTKVKNFLGPGSDDLKVWPNISHPTASSFQKSDEYLSTTFWVIPRYWLTSRQIDNWPTKAKTQPIKNHISNLSTMAFFGETGHTHQTWLPTATGSRYPWFSSVTTMKITQIKDSKSDTLSHSISFTLFTKLQQSAAGESWQLPSYVAYATIQRDYYYYYYYYY